MCLHVATVVVATGTFIWFDKRERRGQRSTYLRAAWWGLVAGVPLGLVATLLARFALGNGAPFVAIFWTVCLIAITVPLLLVRRASVPDKTSPEPVPAE